MGFIASAILPLHPARIRRVGWPARTATIRACWRDGFLRVRFGLRRIVLVDDRGMITEARRLTITDDAFDYERDAQRIAEEEALDGLYVIRTSVPADAVDADGAVRAYKGLSRAERASRCLKTEDLKAPPIHHRLADRVRAQVFLCTLAYYVAWHMREAVAPVLFDDADREAAEAARESIAAPAKRSPDSARKAATRHTADGAPVHSFRTLLQDLSTITRNRIQPAVSGAPAFDKTTRLTDHQARVLALLGVRL